jgi:hypothetical protein
MGGKKISGKQKLRAGTIPKKRVPPSEEPPPNRFIVWRMGQLDLEGTFSWLKLGAADVAQLERELVEFETKTLNELKHLRWLKLIPVSDMTPDGKRRFNEISAEPEGLWQLHLAYGKWRVWGHFEDPSFYIVWWDPNHAVCTGKSVNRKVS